MGLQVHQGLQTDPVSEGSRKHQTGTGLPLFIGETQKGIYLTEQLKQNPLRGGRTVLSSQ